MSWLRALRETARSGLAVERRRLSPLAAARGALGLALVIGFSLAVFGPVVAASSAFGAFQAAIATFQRSWRPRPTLALASGGSLAVSTFLGYLVGSRTALFLALLLLWTFLSGLAWAAGPTAGLIASSNVAIMLVTVTLPTSVATAAGHAAMIFAGGAVQAALVVLLPVRPWGAQRDALADALAAEADYARRLRHDPVAPFDPVPLMTARSAAAVTPRQARRRPAELHGPRRLAERIRPVLASLADPAVGAPAEGPQRDRVRELLAAAAEVHDTGDDADFAAFASAAWPRLVRTAQLLTGDFHEAEDLVQTTLAKVYARWRKVPRAEIDLYVRRAPVNNNNLSRLRRRRVAHLLVPVLPETARHRDAGHAEGVEERAVLFEALADLSIRQRTVMVLRYWDDLTEQEIADVLQCSLGTVKTHARRGLAALRAHPRLASGPPPLSGPPLRTPYGARP
ncbi:SigE family RNA polymerase sigma factor [Streptomyces sp. CC208A]|uniref:SigE family RNA polymerase sigma factor n=1 Tax=Streptomyces sp. CC208A TaxID=3044573 RepID=UPI0024A9C544|nr:SigE family RNA polymerase sigma factor [Streptomyces sp. CC208A]